MPQPGVAGAGAATSPLPLPPLSLFLSPLCPPALCTVPLHQRRHRRSPPASEPQPVLSPSVMCDAYTPVGEPIPTNLHNAVKIFSHPDAIVEEPSLQDGPGIYIYLLVCFNHFITESLSIIANGLDPISGASGWELALVSAPSSNGSAVTESKLLCV